MNDKLHKSTLWLDLINSDWHDYKGMRKHEDRLDKKEWFEKFISHWPFVVLDNARKPLRDLRNLLRCMVNDYSRRNPLSKSDLDALNNIMEKFPVVKKSAGQGSFVFLAKQSIFSHFSGKLQISN